MAWQVWAAAALLLVLGVCGWWVREWHRARWVGDERSTDRWLRDLLGPELEAERAGWARQARRARDPHKYGQGGA